MVLREVKMILLVVEISLINLLHLAPITGPTSLAGLWDKKLEGGGGGTLVCTEYFVIIPLNIWVTQS